MSGREAACPGVRDCVENAAVLCTEVADVQPYGHHVKGTERVIASVNKEAVAVVIIVGRVILYLEKSKCHNVHESTGVMPHFVLQTGEAPHHFDCLGPSLGLHAELSV